MKRCLKVLGWTLLAAVVSGVIALAVWLIRLPEFLRDLYGQWAVGGMVIQFHETYRRLPDNWSELGPMQDESIHAPRYENHDLEQRIVVDFALLKTLQHLADEAGSRDHLPEAIRTRSGTQSCWEGAEPNELVFDYFMGQAKPQWHPQAAIIPGNALKFYLTFPEPMTTGDIFQHLQLIDTDKLQPIAGAFREVELWSPDAKRLTVWLHPGRQKTGVNLNEDEGPVLIEGRHYSLVLSRAATTTHGTALSADVKLDFTAGPPVHTALNPSRWTTVPPRVNGKPAWPMAPVELRFDRTMDWAMVQGAVKADATGHAVVEDSLDGTVWRFYPDQPWKSAKHVIEVDPLIEDICGNNVLRAFEIDVASSPSPAKAGPVRIEFEAKP